jgi:hypothetical protein
MSDLLRGEQPRTMPEAVREPFEVLWQEVVHIRHRWGTFKHLYFSERRVELIKAQADSYFGLDQQIWVESMVLGLARILDGTNGTASLRLLVKRMDSSGPSRVVPDLEDRLEKLEALGAAIEKHRNERIAHINPAYHPSGGKAELPPIHVSTIGQLLEGIADLMNVVGVAVGHGSTVYSAAEDSSAVDSLIFALRKSDRFDELVPWVDRWDELSKGRFRDLSNHRPG